MQEEWKENYFTFPFHLARPRRGKKLEQITCPACGKALTVQVASPAAVQTARTRDLVLAVALFLFSPYVYLTSPRGEISAFQAMLLFGACFAIFGGIALLMSYLTGDFEKTVRLKNGNGHKLFED